MAVFTRIEKAQGGNLYKNVTEDKVVDEASLSSALKEELDLADANTQIDEETITQGEGDGVVNSDGSKADSKPAKPSVKDDEDDKPSKPTRKKQLVRTRLAKEPTQGVARATETVPQTEPGFGWPRANGKTGDIFDVQVPHTQIRVVEGYMVPLSDENYRKKTDKDIYERLQELDLV